MQCYSLEMRRLRHDLLYTYNIVFSPVSEAANDMILRIQIELEAILTKYTCIIVLLMYKNIFPCERNVIIWNNLPAKSEHVLFSLFHLNVLLTRTI